MKIISIAVLVIITISNSVAQVKRIYIAPDDHSDYMWATDEAGYKKAYLDMLDYYISLNESTASDSAPYQNKWNCDGSFWVYIYRQNRTAQEFQKLIDQIKQGKITVPLNILNGLHGVEPLETNIRDMYYAGSLEKEFGLNFELAFSMEDQVMPLGMSSIWAGAGAKYSWHGVCGCATKATGFNSRPHEIYWYKGLDDQKLLMKWYSKTGSSTQLGSYAEAYDPAGSVTLCKTLMSNTSKYPYTISAAFGRGWDNIETLTNAFPTVAKSSTDSDNQVIVSNEIDFFKDFESHYGSALPTETVSYGTEWGNLVASLAEVSASVKRSTEKLRAAEALYSLVSLKDNTFGNSLKDKRQLAWIACGLYFDHDWTADGPVTRHNRATWERKMAYEYGSYVDTLYNLSVKRLGALITKPATQNEVFFVFNPLGWNRTDYCDYSYSGSHNIHVIDRNSSQDVPFQFITKDSSTYLRISAENIPSAGYKLFEIIPGTSSTSFGDAATVNNNIIENSFYKITLTKQGVIKSLIDKSNNNREFAQAINNLYINDMGSGSGENGLTLQTENTGPVSVTLVSSSDLPLKHMSKITLFRNSDRIEIKNYILQNYTNVQTISFSFNLTSPDIWHEEAGAILHAKSITNGGHYSNVIQRLDWLTLNHFADISGNGFGVTLSNRDCYLMKPGSSTTTTLDTNTPQINVLAGGQVDADKGIGIIGQDEDSYFEDFFALTTHINSFNATESMKFALEHQNPLISGKVTGTSGFPSDSFSLISISNPNDLLWTLKPAEEGIQNGIVLRLWNMENNDNNTNISSSYKIIQAKNITHVETDLNSLSPLSGVVNTNLGHNRLQSFRLFLNDTVANTKSSQIITFNALSTKTYGDSDFNAGATSNSGLPVSYSSNNTNVATIVNGLVHIKSAGTSNITASQAGNSYYFPAPSVVQTLTVNKATQVITFDSLPSISSSNPDFSPGAKSSSGLTVTYTSDDTTVASIINNLVHIKGVGTCNITASQSGNSNYLAALNVTHSLTVNNKAFQSITFNEIPDKIYGDSDFNPGATASSGLQVYYSSGNAAVSKIVNNKVHIVGAGEGNIMAFQNGNNNFASALPVIQPIVVFKANLIVTAQDTSRQEGMNNPEFRLSYSGFVNGDDTSTLSVKPYASSTAESSSLPGNYPIIVSSGSDPNYNFTYINGTLTIYSITEVSDINSSDINVYPNPASNFITVNIVNKQIKLFDMQGHILIDKVLNDGTLDISSINTGIYYLLIDSRRIKIVKF